MNSTRGTGLLAFPQCTYRKLILYGSLILCCSLISLLILKFGLLISSVVLAGGMLICLMIISPDSATLFVILAIYTNVPVVAVKFYGVPFLLASSVTLLLVLPLTHYLVVQRRRLVFDETLRLMLLLLLVLLAASTKAVSLKLAWDEVFILLTEGLLLYFLVVNCIRHMSVLRRSIWVILVGGALMGGVSLYSELTANYISDFGGFVQRDREHGVQRGSSESIDLIRQRHDLETSHRTAGPIGQANRFAQILLVFLPPGIMLFLVERSRAKKLVLLLLSLLTLSGFLLTYSRNGFLVFGLICVLLIGLGYIRISHALIAASGLLLVSLIVAPGYVGRITSIAEVQSALTERAGRQTDGAITGRLTEMLSALYVFFDYPVLGVGPGQYMPFYSIKYQANPDIAFRQIAQMRRAHTLYFEYAAETGAVGLIVFLAIPFLLSYRLWQVRVVALRVGRVDLANFATAFGLGIIAFLASSVFEHFSYQRYYWLQLALAGSAIQVFKAQLEESQPATSAAFPSPDL